MFLNCANSTYEEEGSYIFFPTEHPIDQSLRFMDAVKGRYGWHTKNENGLTLEKKKEVLRWEIEREVLVARGSSAGPFFLNQTIFIFLFCFALHQYIACCSTLPKMNSVFPQCHASFYPFREPKDLPLQHHWFTFTKPRLFATVAVRHKEVEFPRFWSVVTNNNIFPQSVWTNFKSFGENELHF